MPTYTFDPIRKLIGIPEGTVEVEMREVYNQMQEWLATDDGMPSEVPIRARGHEDISVGLYTDTIFVLQNGWKLKPLGGPGSPPWPQGVGHHPGFEFEGWREPSVWTVNSPDGEITKDYTNVRFTDDFGQADWALRFKATSAGALMQGRWNLPGPMDFSFMTTMCFWAYIEEEELEHLDHLGVKFSNDVGFNNYVEFNVPHEFMIPGWNHITMIMDDAHMSYVQGTGTLTQPIAAIEFHVQAAGIHDTWIAVDRVAYNHSAQGTCTIAARPWAGTLANMVGPLQARGLTGWTPGIQAFADQPGMYTVAELTDACMKGWTIVNAFVGDEKLQTRDETRTQIMNNMRWIKENFEHCALVPVDYTTRFIAIKSTDPADHVGGTMVDRIQDFADYATSDASVGLNHLPFETPYHVRVIIANKLTHSVADVKNLMHDALEGGLYLNIVFEYVNDSGDANAYSIAEFEEILDYGIAEGLPILSPLELIQKTGTYTLKIVGSCFDEAGVDVAITVPPDSGDVEVVRVVATHGTIWEVGDVFTELQGKAQMIQEIFELHGLDPDKPLVVSKTRRTAGAGIDQKITIDEVNDETTVERQE